MNKETQKAPTYQSLSSLVAKFDLQIGNLIHLIFSGVETLNRSVLIMECGDVPDRKQLRPSALIVRKVDKVNGHRGRVCY
jgi:hypothetical protein